MYQFLTTEQPTSPGIAERRRDGKYAARKPDPEQPLAAWEFFVFIGLCVLALAAVAGWLA